MHSNSSLVPLLIPAVIAGFYSSASGAVILSDEFNRTGGVALSGSNTDVPATGTTWSVSTTNGSVTEGTTNGFASFVATSAAGGGVTKRANASAGGFTLGSNSYVLAFTMGTYTSTAQWNGTFDAGLFTNPTIANNLDGQSGLYFRLSGLSSNGVVTAYNGANRVGTGSASFTANSVFTLTMTQTAASQWTANWAVGGTQIASTTLQSLPYNTVALGHSYLGNGSHNSTTTVNSFALSSVTVTSPVPETSGMMAGGLLAASMIFRRTRRRSVA